MASIVSIFPGHARRLRQHAGGILLSRNLADFRTAFVEGPHEPTKTRPPCGAPCQGHNHSEAMTLAKS